MDIPSVLETQIREGKAVLFLGAGASLAAKNAVRQSPPSAYQLGEAISEQFLGGQFKELGLNQIAELAISETDLFTVQQFVKDKVDGFEPTGAHILATSFRWACIATTNYDRLVELAYERAERSAQTLVPFIENGDRVEDRMQASNPVMLLKLHGCVTRIGNTNCPLILTTEQYIDHKKGRDRTFDHLRSKAYERPIVFVGYGLQDPDIREILMVLALHEATLGKPFEDILEDEYKNVSPLEAQRLYLTLCVLNRFDVKVRAGAMSRIHGIAFEEFKNRLHKPLENVVLFEFDPSVKDFVFSPSTGWHKSGRNY